MPEPARLAHWLQEAWQGDRPPWFLRPLSFTYGAIVRARRLAFESAPGRSVHPGVVTVVIGNLTAGGTGKTPLVLWLAQALAARGRRPGIVLRGYGGKLRAAHLVTAGDDPSLHGDEALLLVRRAGCPVATGARRAMAAKLLVQAGCDIVISDDGLQHLALARDLDVVVIDGERGFGNGALLPAGPLRESASRLACADLVVLHGSDRRGVVPEGIVPLHMRLVPVALRAVGGDREIPLGSLQGATVHALAGIGHPQRFFGLLRALGATPIERARPDHHTPGPEDLRPQPGRWIVMTEKDAVKCRALAAGRDDLYYLQVAAALPDADAARLLDRVLAIRRE